jgi:hypothetical protein
MSLGGVINEMAIRCSFCIISHCQYFVFMAVTADNPVSQKYDVTKGSKTFIALSDKLGYSYFTSSQN